MVLGVESPFATIHPFFLRQFRQFRSLEFYKDKEILERRMEVEEVEVFYLIRGRGEVDCEDADEASFRVF